jgi:solute carrier family 27 (fatty acid transporter), member 1/4
MLSRGLRLVLYFRRCNANGVTVGKLLEKRVAEHPGKVMFFYENDTEWTFKEVSDLGNQVANHFTALGLKKGDVVSLLMENRPELVAIWVGLSKVSESTSF